jgi:hypothetical protein
MQGLSDSPRKLAWSSREFVEGNEFQVTEDLRKIWTKSAEINNNTLHGWWGTEKEASVWENIHYLRTVHVYFTAQIIQMTSVPQRLSTPKSKRSKGFRSSSHGEMGSPLREMMRKNLEEKDDLSGLEFQSCNLQLKVRKMDSTDEIRFSDDSRRNSVEEMEEIMERQHQQKIQNLRQKLKEFKSVNFKKTMSEGGLQVKETTEEYDL